MRPLMVGKGHDVFTWRSHWGAAWRGAVAGSDAARGAGGIMAIGPGAAHGYPEAVRLDWGLTTLTMSPSAPAVARPAAHGERDARRLVDGS